jgi:hypothetical protein
MFYSRAPLGANSKPDIRCVNSLPLDSYQKYSIFNLQSSIPVYPDCAVYVYAAPTHFFKFKIFKKNIIEIYGRKVEGATLQKFIRYRFYASR